MQRNSYRCILERIGPVEGISGNENFKRKKPEEERGQITRKEVILGGAFR
jgi:hypothetical protein